MILEECVAYTALLQKVYADFGFSDILYKGRHAPGGAHRRRRDLGQGRARADGKPAPRPGVEFVIAPGDGAFYGPKIGSTR